MMYDKEKGNMLTKTAGKTEELFLPGFEFTGKRPAHHDEKWREFLKSASRYQERHMSRQVMGAGIWRTIRQIDRREAQKRVDKKGVDSG